MNTEVENSEAMNNQVENFEEQPSTYYLLENDENYKILILYILKDLDNDIKKEILNILEEHEKELYEIEELNRLMNQNWYNLNQNWWDLSGIDYDSEWYYSD